jgi:TolB-like protein/Tfp pilus assembly protein PilF
MSDSSASEHSVVPVSPWARIKDHKVLQWSLAYLGAALALAHGQELLAHTYNWPDVVGRVLMGALVVGFPISIALAWYHGHRGMTRLSAGEMTIVSLLLVIGAGLLIALVRVPEGGRTAPLARAEVTVPAGSASVPGASVAVVPFTNLTGEAGKEYFSDGMAEELINELTKVPGLKVPARTSSFAYKGRNIDIRQIARDLGVATILEGSVRSAGQRIRVTAQLINAQTGYHVWSNTYDRDFGDVFKLQDDISAEIVEALKGSMNAQLPAAVAQTPPTQDPETYRLYLQAQARIGSPAEATSLLTQAIARDPRFARAYAARALMRVVEATRHIIDPDALASADQDANRALGLDPRLSDAHVALGALNAWRGDWLAAESNYQGAMQLDPRDPLPVLSRIIFLLSSVGHMQETLQESLRACALAPGSDFAAGNAGVIYMLLGRDAEAAHYAKLAVLLGGPDNSPAKFWNLIRSSRYAEAADLSAASATGEMRSSAALETMRRAYLALGQPAQRAQAARSLRTLLDELRRTEPRIQHREGELVLSVMLGDLDLAFDIVKADLDQDVQLGTVGTSWSFLWMPEMRPFRLDPRFQVFVTRLKLFDYWKQYGPPDDCSLVGDRLVCR